jgi:hypothetical protein
LHGAEHPKLKDADPGVVHNQVRNAIIESQRAPDSTEINPYFDKDGDWERGFKVDCANPMPEEGSKDSELEYRTITAHGTRSTSGDSVTYQFNGADFGDPAALLTEAYDSMLANAEKGYLEWKAKELFEGVVEKDSPEWWAFHLVKEHGKSYRQAARMLGIPKQHKKVERQVKRVQAHIRAELPPLTWSRVDEPERHHSTSAGYGWASGAITSDPGIVAGVSLKPGEVVFRHECIGPGCKHPERHAPVLTRHL